MNRWAMVTVGVLSILMLLVGVFIGRGTKKVGSVQLSEHSPERQQLQKARDEISVTPEGAELAGLRVVPVGYGEITQTLEVVGEVKPDADKLVQVGSFVSGRVSRLFANVGDEVKRGQVLALIDSTEVAQAQAAYLQAQAKVEAAQKRLENARRLAQAGAFTQRPLQEAQREYADATAQLAVAQAAVERAQAMVDLARAELKRQQELARLGAFRSPPLQEAQKEFAAAKAEVEQAHAELIAAQTALVRAETDFQVADRNAARAERLFQIGTLSRREWEEAQAERQRAQAAVIAAQREVEAKKAALERARRQLELAQEKLRREEEIANQNIYSQAAVQKAEAELRQAERELEQRKAELDQAQKRVQIARAALEREQRIAEQNLLSQRELQEAQALYEQAKLELLAAQNALRLLQTRPGQSAQISILSPISGRVLERRISLGQTVTANDVLFVILDLSSVWVDVQMPEKDAGAVRVGQRVEITTPAYPRQVFVGKVSYIGDTLDDKTRTLLVRCKIANPQRMLKPNMAVRARLQIGKRRALVIPVTAYHEDEGGKAKVFVQEAPNRFVEREVVLGVRNGRWVEVKAGLRVGEKIVAEGAFLLKSEERKSEFGEEGHE